MRDRESTGLRKAIKPLSDKQKESLEIARQTEEFLQQGGEITMADSAERGKDNWAFGNGNINRG
tara:strand:- start:248 stop:439 length:192 start_codon:yes stop_codon:yes gene_type:complete